MKICPQAPKWKIIKRSKSNIKENQNIVMEHQSFCFSWGELSNPLTGGKISRYQRGGGTPVACHHLVTNILSIYIYVYIKRERGRERMRLRKRQMSWESVNQETVREKVSQSKRLRVSKTERKRQMSLESVRQGQCEPEKETKELRVGKTETKWTRERD